MILIYALILIFGFIACWLWVKFVFYVFKSKPKKEIVKNPYVEAQKFKEANDRNYEDYMEWMQKYGSGVPFEKLETLEDQKANEKIKKMF